MYARVCIIVLFVFAYLSYLLISYLQNRVDPLLFQAGGRRRLLNLFLGSFGFFFCSSVAFFVCHYACPGFHFVFSVLSKRLAGKSVSEMACFVSSGR